MAKFQFVRDEERAQSVAQFQGKLISMSAEPAGSFPSGKLYHVGTIEFENDKNQLIQTSCLINKANFDKGMSEGTTYLCSVIFRDGQNAPLIVCSHLIGAARASSDDFGFGTATVSASAPVVVNANPLLVTA